MDPAVVSYPDLQKSKNMLEWRQQIMKVATSLFLITSLVFIALFGISALEHSMSHKQSNCVVSIMSSSPCPTSVVSIMNHHISAIQSLFNVPLSLFIFTMILLITAYIIGSFYLFRFLLLRSQFLTQRSRDHRLRFNFSKHRLNSWLSLFEHSPSF